MWSSVNNDKKTMKDLLYKTILKLEIDEAGEYLRFTTNEKQVYVYYSEGECCSSSWFQYITGVMYLFNTQILDIKEIEINNNVIETKKGCIQLYKIEIDTTKGYVDFEYRNESNGYYGGFITQCDPETLNQNLKFVSITTDYIHGTPQ